MAQREATADPMADVATASVAGPPTAVPVIASPRAEGLIEIVLPNDRWGEFVITPALMLGMENIILDRISFGGAKVPGVYY
jgi:hypothetical protein